MARIAFDLPVTCSRHAAHGRDGADVMLLSLAPPEHVVKRYGRLVVGSGDAIFVHRAQAVRDTRPRGRRRRPSRRMFEEVAPLPCTFLAPRAADVVLAA
jgi:hypothetical protein